MLERFAETRVCHRIVFFSFPFLSIFYFSRCQFTWAAVKSTTVFRQPLSRNWFCTHKSTIFKKIFCWFFDWRGDPSKSFICFCSSCFPYGYFLPVGRPHPSIIDRQLRVKLKTVAENKDETTTRLPFFLSLFERWELIAYSKNQTLFPKRSVKAKERICRWHGKKFE
jgi:hypothetical protein